MGTPGRNGRTPDNTQISGPPHLKPRHMACRTVAGANSPLVAMLPVSRPRVHCAWIDGAPATTAKPTDRVLLATNPPSMQGSSTLTLIAAHYNPPVCFTAGPGPRSIPQSTNIVAKAGAAADQQTHPRCLPPSKDRQTFYRALSHGIPQSAPSRP